MSIDHDILARLGLVVFGGALFVRFLVVDFQTFGWPWDRRRNGRRLANTAATVLALLIAVMGLNSSWFEISGLRPLGDGNALLYAVSVTMALLLLAGWWEARHRDNQP